MTEGRHPWPTDGVTRKQMDRQTDRLDRRIDLSNDTRDALKGQIEILDRRLRELEKFFGEGYFSRLSVGGNPPEDPSLTPRITGPPSALPEDVRDGGN